jgi:hypothetical protein
MPDGIPDLLPDTNSTDLMEQLLPFLYNYEDNTMLDPDDWMQQYGTYLTPFDPEPDKTVLERLNLANRDSKLNKLQTIKDIQAGIGLSGFGGSYLGDVASTARDKLALELQANYANAMQEQRSGQQSWQSDLYASLGALGGMEAFTSPPNVDVITDEDIINQYMNDWMNPAEENLPAYQSEPCPCPGGGVSVACCDYVEDDTQAQDTPMIPDPDNPDLDFEDLQQYYYGLNPLESENVWQGFDEDFINTVNQASWGSEALQEISEMNLDQSAYTDCIAGASTTEEMQSCYNNYVSDFTDAMQDAEYGINQENICNEGSPYYDQALCNQFMYGDMEEDEWGISEEQDDQQDEGYEDFGDDYYDPDEDWNWQGGVSP